MMAPPVPDPIHLRSLGGDGTAEIEALLGDKILDLLLYWRLTRRFAIKSEGHLTQLRSVYGTAVEAIVGRSFLQHNGDIQDFNLLSISPSTVNVAYEILDAIETCVKTSAEHIVSGLPADTASNADEEMLGHKNPAQALFEWLQGKLRITNPADTVTVYQSSGIESGIQVEAKFVAVFQLPRSLRVGDLGAPTNVEIRGDPCPNKKLARDNVARYVLRHFKIDSTLSFAAAMRKPPPPSQRPPPSYLMPKIDPKKQPLPHEKPASSRVYEWLQKKGVGYPAKAIDVIDVLGEDDVTRDGSFQGVFTMPNTDPPEIVRGGKFANKRDAKEDVAAAVLALYDVSSTTSPADDAVSISGSHQSVIPPPSTCVSTTITAPATSKLVQPGVAVRRIETVSVTSQTLAVDSDLADIWNKIQSGYGRTASSNSRESIICVDPVSGDDSLAFVNKYLSQYCRETRLTQQDLQRILTPDLIADDVSLPSIAAGLLNFEPMTPWDSSSLREWFQMSWAKKPVNALCLLKARIGAQFMFKFWKCRLNGGVQTVQDSLVLVAFWDGDFGPFFGVGVGVNPGLAAKAALAQLWPMVKPHVDALISAAEEKYAEAEQRAIEATQLAIAAAQSG